MFKTADNINKLLENLNLTEEEKRIYLYINKNGTSSALQLSRGISLSRTKVYRNLDSLISKNLILQVVSDRGFRFERLPLDNLNLVVSEKEAELETLKNSIPILIKELEKVSSESDLNSKVLYYKGLEGLKQVTWNSLKAKDTVRIYELSNDMSAFIDEAYSEKIRGEFLKRKIFSKQLTNLKHIKPYTKHSEVVKKYWEVRHISEEKLKIKFETLIYNDIVCFYTFKEKNIFCVEIHNKNLAEMQTQLFDFVWESAQKMKVISNSGEAAL